METVLFRVWAWGCRMKGVGARVYYRVQRISSRQPFILPFDGPYDPLFQSVVNEQGMQNFEFLAIYEPISEVLPQTLTACFLDLLLYQREMMKTCLTSSPR